MNGRLVEVFSSFQGEGGNVRGSCFGKRQIFIRFCGCNLKCIWCDTPEARSSNRKECRIEQTPGMRNFRVAQNPISSDRLLEGVKKLKTTDLHSINFTGGEPLFQPNFAKEAAEKLVSERFVLFLETNASLPVNAKNVKDLFDYVSTDIKDESARAANDWKDLVEREFECIRIFVDAGKNVYAKVVITPETKRENVAWYAEELAKLNVPLVLQIVTPRGSVKKTPGWKQLFELNEAAAEHLGSENISISYQMHKAIGML